MAQFIWPPVSISGSSNPSVGANGQPIPTSSNQAGGQDTNGNLQAVKVGTDGTQYVILAGTSAISGHVIVDSGTISSIATGTVTLNGTPPVAVASGTLGLVSSLASGTVTINGGTIASVTSGTVTISGTPGVVVSSGTISSVASGTVTLSGTPPVAVASGTLGLVSSLASGTVTISGTPGVVVSSGTLSSIASGTVTISGTPAISGTVTTTSVGAASSAVTSVASGTISTALLTSNASRKQATFFNDSTAILYLKLGATASTSSYTVQLASFDYYELPDGKIYSGAIDGIWSAVNGNVRITELS